MTDNPQASSDLILGLSSGKLELPDLAALRDTSADLAGQAQRSLLLLSAILDPRIYDQQPFLDALHSLGTESELSRIRILLLDNQRLVKHHHRLLELARRLTSRVEIRRPIAEYAERSEEYLVVDGRGYIYREHAGEYAGWADYHDPLTARRLTEEFQEAWDHSQPDPELRRLHL